MAVADLIITKPGGLTTSEALALGKPIFILNPIPGQEAANSDFLLEHGAAQGPAVRALLGAAGLVGVGTRRDLAGHERVTEGRRPR